AWRGPPPRATPRRRGAPARVVGGERRGDRRPAAGRGRGLSRRQPRQAGRRPPAGSRRDAPAGLALPREERPAGTAALRLARTLRSLRGGPARRVRAMQEPLVPGGRRGVEGAEPDRDEERVEQ